MRLNDASWNEDWTARPDRFVRGYGASVGLPEQPKRDFGWSLSNALCRVPDIDSCSNELAADSKTRRTEWVFLQQMQSSGGPECDPFTCG